MITFSRPHYRHLLIQALGKLTPNNWPAILMYHATDPYHKQIKFNTTPQIFEQQIAWLKESAITFITMDDIVNSFAGKTTLPPNSVAITFDDGYCSNYDYALPILERYNVPAIIYVATQYIDTGKGAKDLPACSWSQLIQLADHPLITIGGHTVSHPKLSQLPNDQALEEIIIGKQQLQNRLGKIINHFAYPKGAYHRGTPQLVSTAGFQSAVTVRPGLITSADIDIFRIPRIAIDDKVPFAVFQVCAKRGVNMFYELRRLLSQLAGNVALS